MPNPNTLQVMSPRQPNALDVPLSYGPASSAAASHGALQTRAPMDVTSEVVVQSRQITMARGDPMHVSGSPTKAILEQQAHYYAEMCATMRQQAIQEMESQRHSFVRTAEQFEQASSDAREVAMAKAKAVASSQLRQALTSAKEQLNAEIQQAKTEIFGEAAEHLSQQRDLVRGEAEAYVAQMEANQQQVMQMNLEQAQQHLLVEGQAYSTMLSHTEALQYEMFNMSEQCTHERSLYEHGQQQAQQRIQDLSAQMQHATQSLVAQGSAEQNMQLSELSYAQKIQCSEELARAELQETYNLQMVLSEKKIELDHLRQEVMESQMEGEGQRLEIVRRESDEKEHVKEVKSLKRELKELADKEQFQDRLLKEMRSDIKSAARGDSALHDARGDSPLTPRAQEIQEHNAIIAHAKQHPPTEPSRPLWYSLTSRDSSPEKQPPEARGDPTRKAIETTKDEDTKKESEAKAIKFKDFPSTPGFRNWKMEFKKKVASSSPTPTKAFQWITKIEHVHSVEELKDHESFETLDYKIASGLSEICHGEFKRKITVLEEKAAIEGHMVNGRQIAFFIYEHFRTCEIEGSLLEFEDLLGVTLRGDNLVAFENDWDTCLTGLKHVPPENILESLFRKQLEQSTQLKGMMTLYQQDYTQKSEPRSYLKLRSMLKSHINQRRLNKCRDELHQKK